MVQWGRPYYLADQGILVCVRAMVKCSKHVYMTRPHYLEATQHCGIWDVYQVAISKSNKKWTPTRGKIYTVPTMDSGVELYAG